VTLATKPLFISLHENGTGLDKKIIRERRISLHNFVVLNQLLFYPGKTAYHKIQVSLERRMRVALVQYKVRMNTTDHQISKKVDKTHITHYPASGKFLGRSLDVPLRTRIRYLGTRQASPNTVF